MVNLARAFLAFTLVAVAASLACRDEPVDGPRYALPPAPDAGVPSAFETPPAVGTEAACGACGNVLTVAADTPRAERDGKHYVFCCPGCKTGFDKDPGKYLKKKGKGGK